MPKQGELENSTVQLVAPQSSSPKSKKQSSSTKGGDGGGGTSVNAPEGEFSQLSLEPARGQHAKDTSAETTTTTANDVTPPLSMQSQKYSVAAEASHKLKGLQKSVAGNENKGLLNTNDMPTTTSGMGLSAAVKKNGTSQLHRQDPAHNRLAMRIKKDMSPSLNQSAAAAAAAHSSRLVPRGGKEASDEIEEEEEEEEGGGEESSEISASDEDGSWISWFCSLRGNEFFCEVDEDYIQDDFNLTGLNGLVPYYDYALDMVLDVEMPMEDSLTEAQQEIVESAAEMLYGLIHARYIVTNRGMHAMYEKYRSAAFGRCPHVFCQGQPVLPVGLSDLPRNYTVNVFCPRCHGLFFPKSTRQANIDGAYFGTTFPHLYLMTHPDVVPNKPTQQYQPRIYGFKINQSSLYYRNHEEPSATRHNSGRERSSRKKNRHAGVR